MDLEDVLNVMRRVDTVCAVISFSTEATGTSGGSDSFAEECMDGTCGFSDPSTDISSSPLTGRFGGSQSGLGRDVATGCHG